VWHSRTHTHTHTHTHTQTHTNVCFVTFIRNFKNLCQDVSLESTTFHGFIVKCVFIAMLGAFPVTTTWRVLGLRMEERPPAANILNKQPRINGKGWSFSLGGLGVRLTTLQHKTINIFYFSILLHSFYTEYVFFCS
jgi:hypothetical protein